MLKFSEFVYKINEAEENRGVDVLNQQQTTTTQTTPAPTANAPATLFQLFNVFIQKYNQRSPISSGTTTSTDDLTLRVSKFQVDQNIRITTMKGITIDAVILLDSNRKSKIFKLEDSSFEKIKNFLKPTTSPIPNQNMNQDQQQQQQQANRAIYFKSLKKGVGKETTLVFMDEKGVEIPGGRFNIIIKNVETTI